MKEHWFNKIDIQGETPLDRAYKSGNRALTDLFLRQEQECSIEEEDQNSQTAYWGLGVAVAKLIDEGDTSYQNDQFGDSPLLSAVRDGQLEDAEMLLEQDADINEVDDSGMTSLHWVALNGREDIAEILIDRGADVNMREEYAGGVTPMEMASMMGYDELVDTFKCHGGTF